MKQVVNIGLIYCSFLCFCACSEIKNPDSFQRSIPEKEGISSQAILNFIEAIEQSGEEWHSFIFLRHGKVIAEGWWNPYQPELKQTIYSTSKTFTSTAVGFAVSENKLSVDDKVITFFPDLLPDSISPYLSQLCVKHLLSMTAGQNPEPIRNGNQWVKDFLASPIVDEPGTKFFYNSMATYMLSAIVQKVSGERLLDYLRPRLLEPLAIREAEWEICPQGINTGGWGLRIHTEDMAKLGQLYLQKGKWNGKQLLPESWIEEATTAKIYQNPGLSPEKRATDDWAQGYCYQIWRCRNNAFRADGAYGQLIVVMPEQDAVIVVQANAYDMQKEVNLIWEHLLSAMHPQPLPADENAVNALHQKLASLAINPPKGITSSLKTNLTGEKIYSLSHNEENIPFSLRITGDTCILNGFGYLFYFGKEKWLAGETNKPAPNLAVNPAAFSEFPPFKVYGSYHLPDEQTLSLSLRYIESPHTELITCRLNGDSIYVTVSNSINYENKTKMCGVKIQ
ncbi:MAG: beta-lactamase family protein [Prevotellaceae bacterium]|jgi:CubicO group peptidase (beta-lactamase class C family)|nr:beta-lactamase family protein [Prevotellaceae bacterium]